MLGNHNLLLTGDVLYKDTCLVQVKFVEFYERLRKNLVNDLFEFQIQGLLFGPIERTDLDSVDPR